MASLKSLAILTSLPNPTSPADLAILESLANLASMPNLAGTSFKISSPVN
jgi:hypothetical protein